MPQTHAIQWMHASEKTEYWNSSNDIYDQPSSACSRARIRADLNMRSSCAAQRDRDDDPRRDAARRRRV